MRHDLPLLHHDRYRATLQAIGGFFVLNPLLAGPEGPWDFTVKGTERLMAGLDVATELLAAALTAAFVALVRLRRGMHVITAALILVAAVRMVFAPTP